METSLYIHIPFCVTKCDYCDFFSIACGQNNVSSSYIDAVISQIKYLTYYFKVTKWNTVYIGGGTPSLISIPDLYRLLDSIRPLCAPSTEITMEANPDDLDEYKLCHYYKAGINRLSCGIQALDQLSLSTVNRRSSLSKVYEVLSLIDSKWEGEVSYDIICSLPSQSEDTFLEGLQTLCSYKPSHISMYSLTIEENTPLYKRFISGKLEYDQDKADDMWLKGRDLLEENGYLQYEVSNFYHKDFGKMSNHNMVYWNLDSYLSCGSGGTMSVYDSGIRCTNTLDIKSYIDFWNNLQDYKKVELSMCPMDIEKLNKETISFEFFMMGLRTRRGVCIEDYIERFNETPTKFLELFDVWSSRGLTYKYVENSKAYYALNKQGIMMLNLFLEALI